MDKTYRPLVTRARRLQFSLRCLFAATTIAAVWFGMLVHRAREQQIAVRLIKESGGTVYFDFQESPCGSGKFDSEARCRWPQWLVGRLGEDFFSNVVSVELDSDLSASSVADSRKASRLDVSRRLPALPKLRFLTIDGGVTDELLRFVGQLECLEVIWLFDHGNVTDAGIAHLSGLRNLKVFALFDSSITDKSLDALRGLRRLVQLQLEGAHVAGLGLANLSGLTQLQFLDLARSDRITDPGISSLAGLISLEKLDLSGADVTSAGLAHLKRLKRLRVLNLSDNDRFARDGMDSLSDFSGLEELYLHNAGVTAAGMRSLAPLKRLRKLDVSDNPQVTDAGVSCLSQSARMEELNLHNTSVSSSAASHLLGLTKLRGLDLSENREVDVRALPVLARLVSLAELDLHNTTCMTDGERAALLRSLPALRHLDISGTGSDTWAVQSALPICRVAGSRASNFHVPDIGQGFMSLSGEVGLWNLRKTAPDAHMDRVPAPETLPPKRLLERMIALTKVSGAGATFARRRPVLERFLATLGDSPRGPESLADEAQRLAAHCRSDSVLHRLYSASVNFEFADALNEHLEYLAGIQQAWALTDVERDEYSQALKHMRRCLRDAREQLAQIWPPSAGDSEVAITRIWTATARPKHKATGRHGTARTFVLGIAKPL